MFKITNLRYQHSKKDPIYRYDLSLNPQEIVAIMGQSGSGKSTLLDLIAGFLEPLEGQIVLDKTPLEKLPIEKRPISILFQNHNLFEHLSVQQNILLGVKKVLKDAIDEVQKVEAILKEVGLEAYEHTIASKLSGGQQQRVALARVLLRREPILLLDEPFSGLDEKTHLEMLDLVANITQKYHLHTILITHNKEDAKRIASKCYTMQSHTLTLL